MSQFVLTKKRCFLWHPIRNLQSLSVGNQVDQSLTFAHVTTHLHTVDASSCHGMLRGCYALHGGIARMLAESLGLAAAYPEEQASCSVQVQAHKEGRTLKSLQLRPWQARPSVVVFYPSCRPPVSA